MSKFPVVPQVLCFYHGQSKIKHRDETNTIGKSEAWLFGPLKLAFWFPKLAFWTLKLGPGTQKLAHWTLELFLGTFELALGTPKLAFGIPK